MDGPLLFLTVFLIACGAAFVQSMIGFGYSLLFAPIAALVLLPSDSVAISIVSGTAISVFLYVEHTPRAALRSVAPMAVAAVLTAPAGLWLLVVADEEALHLLIGLAVLVSAVVNLRQGGHTHVAKADRASWQVAVGAVSGVMRGAVSLPGPPVILYQHWIGGGAAAIRSRMFVFFVWTGIPTVVIAALSGVFDADVWRYSLAAIPALPAGILAGRVLRPRLPEPAFRWLSMALLAGTSAVAVAGSVVRMVG
ncbi:MAG: sulfite exporter TauE/SafE family protein [Dehalococcoidia bacterium]